MCVLGPCRPESLSSWLTLVNDSYNRLNYVFPLPCVTLIVTEEMWATHVLIVLRHSGPCTLLWGFANFLSTLNFDSETRVTSKPSQQVRPHLVLLVIFTLSISCLSCWVLGACVSGHSFCLRSELKPIVLIGIILLHDTIVRIFGMTTVSTCSSGRSSMCYGDNDKLNIWN